MCVEIKNNNMNAIIELDVKQTKKVSYSIKKVLKQLFKQHKTEKLITKQNIENTKKESSMESLESIQNSQNADIESGCVSLESYQNDVNERLSACTEPVSYEMEDYEYGDITTVPVHFARTAHGTFFWTAASDLPVDNDLIEPLYCCTANQIAVPQMQDRWAQA
ncbi:enhancer of split m4 protein [Teleopsis dalmanni]|uniref:Enhancer of split region protein HLHm4 n=1 Tax=Teleopsis dalmanni TaxID=139649 RepID=G9I1L8_TELDL|nr:enhancer of split m4 protein [Teleopsis dalmanni]AEV91205.1 enhancer of split region protein HLHm4 [Teleopsis dalmanni]